LNFSRGEIHKGSSRWTNVWVSVANPTPDFFPGLELVGIQPLVTKAGPVANLTSHLADPTANNIFSFTSV
jgi:hypothetical protein